MNNPFDYTPSAECDAAYLRLIDSLENLKRSNAPDNVDFIKELEGGKMLGVLIAADSKGVHNTLYAFSGQMGGCGFYFSGFVEPAFDYLEENGYFKSKEREIVAQSHAISDFEANVITVKEHEYRNAKDLLTKRIEGYKEICKLSKMKREERRHAGDVDDQEKQAMIRQSQFEKAELHRLKKGVSASLAPLEEELNAARSQLAEMKQKRSRDSESLQRWLFSNFHLLNARGERRSLLDIFSATSIGTPPSGAGECCAPKLLQAAYRRGWRPLAIAEYWYGKAKDGELRIHGQHYPACRGKCLPVLGWMLEGLEITPPLTDTYAFSDLQEPEIIYENEWFCVVNKPAGMLSVPGRGEAISVEEWLGRRYGAERYIKMVHRLDQDTSGLLLAAFGAESYTTLQRLFATRNIKKTYIADLEGDYREGDLAPKGCIALPIASDWLDRPRQRIDMQSGKEAATEYEFISVTDKRSRIRFRPLTGRTHQLRVHAASDRGLAMPIVGDRLYGNAVGRHTQRLHLHAHKIEFLFPMDGNQYCFESDVPF